MADSDEQQVKRIDTKTFTWRIENFSKLKETKIYSDAFLAGGHKWRILLFPKGNNVNYLSVYLDFAASATMPYGWSVFANIVFTLVDQVGGSSSVRKDTEHNFNAKQSDWGFTAFVPLTSLLTKGFLVDDTLVIEVQVSTKAAADDAKVIEADQPPKPTQVSVSKSLSSQSNGDANSSLSASSVQLTTRSLIAELSTMAANRDSSSSGHGSDVLQHQNEKLDGFFDMSLESLFQTKSLDEVTTIASEILELLVDPLQKTVLKDLIFRLTEFKDTVPSSLTTIKTSLAVESSKAQIAKDLEERLAYRKDKLIVLEAEVSRLGEEGSKLDDQIQQLTTRKAKILEDEKSTAVELEKASQEASKELDELKKENDERKEAVEKRMRAMEKLAQANASWKLFKNLGWR